MFSMCSELTPRLHVLVSRIPGYHNLCSPVTWLHGQHCFTPTRQLFGLIKTHNFLKCVKCQPSIMEKFLFLATNESNQIVFIRFLNITLPQLDFLHSFLVLFLKLFIEMIHKDAFTSQTSEPFHLGLLISEPFTARHMILKYIFSNLGAGTFFGLAA